MLSIFRVPWAWKEHPGQISKAAEIMKWFVADSNISDLTTWGEMIDIHASELYSRLRGSMVKSISQKQFLPQGALSKIVTHEHVLRLLYMPSPEFVDRVVTTGSKIFAILTLIDRPRAIKTFFDHGVD